MNKDILSNLFDYFSSRRDFFYKKFGHTSYAHIFTDKQAFWKHIEHNYKIFLYINQEGKNVWLDYGCGWGFWPFCLIAFGVQKVIGIDIRVDEIEIANKIKLDVFPRADVSFIRSAVLDSKNSVDVITFFNVISHLKLPIDHILRAYHTLAYAGIISIYDSNNSFSVKVGIRNKLLWQARESGLIQLRENLFRERGVNITQANYYARLSAGLSKEDIDALILCKDPAKVTSYLQRREKTLPPQYNDPPIVDERKINPLMYRNILLDMGFECIKMKATCRLAPTLEQLLNILKIGFVVLPSFHIVAEKRRLPLQKDN